MIMRLILIAAAMSAVIACGTFYALDKRAPNAPARKNECVILLHGLCRSALSMKAIERHLVRNGYTVMNLDYPSTRKSITATAEEDVAAAVSESLSRGHARVHFITHSLGAIVVRRYLQNHQLPIGSRIVMLAPPNQGSELADWAYEKIPRLTRLAGPAMGHLGTGKRTLIARLEPIAPQTGIIIGNDSWNPLFSKILPGSDDGKVTVERSKLEEMRDFLILPCNHSTILFNKNARFQMVHFLEKGHFFRSTIKLDRTAKNKLGIAK